MLGSDLKGGKKIQKVVLIVSDTYWDKLQNQENDSPFNMAFYKP